MNLQKLKREIEHQTRNGRKEVYVRLEDLKILNKTMVDSYGKGRIFVNAAELEDMIEEYEKKQFKESLKVDVTELQNKINNKEGEKIYYKDNERDD